MTSTFFTTGTETQLAYCIILETSFTIVAVNMPSLWYYTAGIKPESVLRSVRSLVSLGSGRGSQNNSFKEIGTSTNKATQKDVTRSRQSLDTQNSTSSIKPWSTPVVETYAMSDMDRTTPSTKDIHVERDFRLGEDQV